MKWTGVWIINIGFTSICGWLKWVFNVDTFFLFLGLTLVSIGVAIASEREKGEGNE